MASPVSQVVSVTVTRATRPLTQAAFDTPMFLAAVNFFAEGQQFRIYSSTTAMASDGFPTTHPAYVYATKAFGQNGRPDNIVIGRQDYTAYIVTPTVDDETLYTLRIGVSDAAKNLSFTTDATATGTEIVDAFVALVNDDTDLNTNVVATNAADTLVLTPTVGGEVAVSSITNNLAIVLDGAEDILTAVSQVNEATNDFFFVASQSQEDADILALAGWANANDKMYMASVDIATVGDNTVEDDIASQLKALQYDNTTTLAVLDTNLDEYSEGGMMGSLAAINPGVTTLFAKTLQGTPAENFSQTQTATVTDKNSNYYDFRGGAGFLYDGRQASGEFFDTIRFSLWAKARTAESIFGLLKRKSDLGQKVPTSNAGDQMITQAIFNGMINIGTRRGAILTAADGAVDPVVRIPNREDRSINDRAQRILRDVEIEFTYSGAVQDVRVQIYVQI